MTHNDPNDPDGSYIGAENRDAPCSCMEMLKDLGGHIHMVGFLLGLYCVLQESVSCCPGLKHTPLRASGGVPVLMGTVHHSPKAHEHLPTRHRERTVAGTSKDKDRLLSTARGTPVPFLFCPGTRQLTCWLRAARWH